jgi:hypothetical protein
MADYSTQITQIETAMATGNLVAEIEVDGQRVRNRSWAEMLARYEWLKQLQAQQNPAMNPYSRGRIQVGDPGDGGR